MQGALRNEMKEGGAWVLLGRGLAGGAGSGAGSEVGEFASCLDAGSIPNAQLRDGCFLSLFLCHSGLEYRLFRI
jgi:hypothetical protein